MPEKEKGDNPFVKPLEDIRYNEMPKGTEPIEVLQKLLESLSTEQVSAWLTHENTLGVMMGLCRVDALEWWERSVSSHAKLFDGQEPSRILREHGKVVVGKCFGEYNLSPDFCSALVKIIGVRALFDMRGEYGDTVFNKTARNNKIEVVKHLMTTVPSTDEERQEMRRCLQSPGSHGMTPLHSAIGSLGYKDDSKCFEMLELFLEVGGLDANQPMASKQTLNKMPTKGSTPLLYYAGESSYFDGRIPELLLKYGADVAAVDEEGNNCLHNVASNHMSGDTQHGARFVAWLLDHQLCDAVNERKRRTALQYACMNGKAKMVELLLTQQHTLPGSSMESYLLMKDSAGQTALHYAATYSNDAPGLDKCVKLITDQVPETIGQRNGDDLTPMQLAVSAKNLKFDQFREEFYIGWDDHHEGCKTCKHHVDGGVASVVLALSLCGAEALTGEQVEAVLETREKTLEVEEEKLRLKPDETCAWWWKLEPQLLRSVLATASNYERLSLWQSAQKAEKQKQDDIEAERVAKLAAKKKAKEATDKQSSYKMYAVVALALAWYWFR